MSIPVAPLKNAKPVFGPEHDPRQKRSHKRPRKSIFLDRINPQDFLKFNFMFCCEQCSHFDSVKIVCTMGYQAQHQRASQLAKYNLTGKMALCRFMEID
jgi:hypothetical protein